MFFNPRKLGLALTAMMIAIMTGCLSNPDTKQAGGSEVENEVYGFIYNTKGKPVSNAEVRIYTVDHIPGSPLPKAAKMQTLFYQTHTDDSGRYVIDSVPKGDYTVLGNKDSLASFHDSVFIGAPGQVSSDTLKTPGSLSGFIKLQPNHDPRTATVQVLGTDVYVNADARGAFTLAGMAEGDYRVRVVSTLPDYTPLFAQVTIRSGKSDTLPDSLEVPYTGIPVVAGLAAAYDTVLGIVTLRWNKTSYTNFQAYAVYRDPAGAVILSKYPYNSTRITDTMFQDTLNPYGDTAGQAWEYRVVVMAKSGSFGETYSVATIHAPSLGLNMGDINLRCSNCQDTSSVMPGDTLHIIASWSNAAVSVRTLNWYSSDTDSLVLPIRTKPVLAPQGTDTLTYLVPNSAPNVMLTAILVDAGWRRSAGYFYIPVRGSIPLTAHITVQGAVMDSVTGLEYVLKGQRFVMKGTFQGGKMPIATGWDTTGTGYGNFVHIPGDSLAITASQSDTTYSFLFQARDSTGMIARDSLYLQTR